MTDLPLPPLSPPPFASPSVPQPPPAPKQFRPTVVIAWIVILGVCGLLPWLRAEKVSITPTTQPLAVSRVNMQSELAGRMWVGFGRLIEAQHDANADKQLEQFAAVPKDNDADRMANAIVLAELGKRDQALDVLNKLADPAAGRELRRKYKAAGSSAPNTGPAAAPLSARLHDRLGWFADLADTYGRDDADPHRAKVLAQTQRAMVVIIGMGVVVGGAGVVGLGLCITAIVLFATNKLRFTVGRTQGPWYVYGEAFAIYLGGFIGISLLIARFLPGSSLNVEVLGLGTVVVLAVIWPLLRGVPLATLRRDWGVHTGRGVLREMLCGVGGYLAGLPLVALGFLITIKLISITKVMPTHPIENADNHSVAGVLSLYLIASVFAPLTEELLFRGALVSHLRAGMNAVLAAVVSGLVFAAVHPQGWTLVPTLGAIGAVLALVRQWRGTLVASITAHALHNGVLVTLMVVLMR